MAGTSPLLVLLLLSFTSAVLDGAFWKNIAKISDKDLSNLGATIQKEVAQNLKPLRDMGFKVKVKNGNGGTTIASFKDKRLVVRNGIFYECKGTIREDGSCSGTLTKIKLDKKKDFCYLNANTIINKWYCLANGRVNFSQDQKYHCSSTDSKTLLISQDEYRKVCGDLLTVTYKFFTSEALDESVPDVRCSGTKAHVCTLVEHRSTN